MLGTFPREHRYILDADGRFNPYIVVDGYDRSHRDEAERAEWLDYYEALADRIIKPTIAPSDDRRVTALPFFGFNPDEVLDPAEAPPKKYDILHVGHNWYRWKEVSDELLPAFEQIRDQVGEIGFLGLWWDGVPEWAHAMGLEPAYRRGDRGVPPAAHPRRAAGPLHRRDPDDEQRRASTSSRSARSWRT